MGKDIRHLVKRFSLGKVETVSGDSYIPSGCANDSFVLLLKPDASGNELWHKTYGVANGIDISSR